MSRLGLAARLSLLISSAILASAIAIGTLGAVAGNRLLFRGVTDDLSHLARDYAEAIGLYFGGARSLLKASAPVILQAMTGASSGSAGTEAATAARIFSASHVFEYLLLADGTGNVLLTAPASLKAGLSRPDVGFADWFKETLRRREVVISDLWISTVTQRPTVIVAVPLIGPDGRLLGVWAGGVELSRLSALSHGSAESSAYGFVTDSKGLIVAHQTRPALVVSQTDYSGVNPVREALAGLTGTIDYVSPIDGISKLAAFLPLILQDVPTDRKWAIAYVTPTSEAFRPLRIITAVLAGLALVLAAGLALSSALIIRRTLRPVGLLADAARAMGGGNLAVRAPKGLRFELAELAGAFNIMAESVAATQGSLEQRAVNLEQLNRQLETANKELESFSYSVSHDLRAPLRSIDGFSKAIVEDYSEVLDDEGKEYLRFLRESAQKMGRLIDDMLKLSRVTRGELADEDVDLSSNAREIARDLEARDPRRSLQFIVQHDLVTRGDGRLLRSALQNLLENAWKFTRGREVALIEFGQDGREGCFYVRDNGVGLEMKYADKLFKPFQRLHADSDFDGTGVGLATVKRILERHGGRAWVESEPGKGTTFFFTIREEKRQ